MISFLRFIEELYNEKLLEQFLAIAGVALVIIGLLGHYLGLNKKISAFSLWGKKIFDKNLFHFRFRTLFSTLIINLVMLALYRKNPFGLFEDINQNLTLSGIILITTIIIVFLYFLVIIFLNIFMQFFEFIYIFEKFPGGFLAGLGAFFAILSFILVFENTN